MLDVQARLTSTATVDTGLTGGLRYCYRVVAVDASGNPSAESDSACTTPPAGNDLGDPVDTGTPTPGPAGTGLAEVDVSDIVCDEEFTGAVISSETTLDAACYRVVGNILVADGGVLTVSAGAVLKFGEGAALIVSNGGALNASERPTFPSFSAEPGSKRVTGLEYASRIPAANSTASSKWSLSMRALPSVMASLWH